MLIHELFLIEAQDRETALIHSVADRLNAINPDVAAKYLYKKSNGTIKHLRLRSQDVEADFDKIGMKLEFLPGDKRATGKVSYRTFSATLTKPLGEFNTGETIFIVNTWSEESKISNKKLTPGNLHLESSDAKTADEIIDSVAESLSAIDLFSTEEMLYLEKLLTLTKSKIHDVRAPDSLADEDLNRIAIDFGEVFAACWYSRVTGIEGILFPSGNNPLVDFVLEDDKNHKPVSAKAGKGAPPSLGIVVTEIESNEEYFEDTYGKDTVDTLKLIQDSSAIEGGILANQKINTPGFRLLKRITGLKDLNRKTIENYLGQFSSPEEMYSRLDELFALIGTRPTAQKVEAIFADSAQQRVGIISSSMTTYLVNLFNKDPKYSQFKDILVDVLQRMTVDQLYTNLSRNRVEFMIKPFETATFKWINNASAAKPNLSKMGFIMT